MKNEESDFKLSFKTEQSSEGNFLEIEEEECHSQRKLKMRVYLSNVTKKSISDQNDLFSQKYDYTIIHVKRILKCFEENEIQYKDFKKLMMIFRAWR